MDSMLIQLTPDLLTNKLTCLMSSDTSISSEHNHRWGQFYFIFGNCQYTYVLCEINLWAVLAMLGSSQHGWSFNHLRPCLTRITGDTLLSAVPAWLWPHSTLSDDFCFPPVALKLFSSFVIKYYRRPGSGQIPNPPVKLIPLQISSLMGHSTDDS